jgi:hypothetical protein
VVPLTTAAKTPLPTHVTFNVNGREQTVLCEQIRTVSQNVFANVNSCYKFTMSEEGMKRVDEALAIQLGLQIVFPNSDRYWESLSKLIRAKVREAVEHSRVDSLDVSKVASLLEAKVDSLVNETVNPVPPAPPAPEVQPVEEVKVESKKTSKRRVWTDEAKHEFLKYYDEHGAKKTSEKYDLQIGSVHSTRFKFYKELRNGKNEA